MSDDLRCWNRPGTTYSTSHGLTSKQSGGHPRFWKAPTASGCSGRWSTIPATQSPVRGDARGTPHATGPDRVVVAIKRSMALPYLTPAIDRSAVHAAQVSARFSGAGERRGTRAGRESRRGGHYGAGLLRRFRTGATGGGRQVGRAERDRDSAGTACGWPWLSRSTEWRTSSTQIWSTTLGGGTFDVTMIHACTKPGAGNSLNLHIDTLVQGGKRELGGLDWIEHWRKSCRTDPTGPPRGRLAGCQNQAVLLDNCEKAKRDLTRMSRLRRGRFCQSSSRGLRGGLRRPHARPLLQTDLLIRSLERVAGAGGRTWTSTSRRSR